jgi:hypothetical protein
MIPNLFSRIIRGVPTTFLNGGLLGSRLTCALVTLLVPGVIGAQTADELVARHIEARGGYEKLKAVTTIKITRTVATPFSDVRVILYRKRPQLFRAEQGPAQPGAALTARGINADGAWDTTQGKIVMRSEAAAAEARDLDADFDGLLVDWRQKGHTVTFEGKETLPAGEAYKLRVKTKSGAERIIYLDARTYLERRQTGTLNLPGGRQFNVVLDFDNYRDVNGVKFPFDINEDRTGKEPSLSYVTYTEKVEINLPMDDSLFAPPAK